MRPFGLYIHIPFCQSRCGYCDFVTFTEKESHIPRYVKALAQELILYAVRPRQSRTTLSTVFLGGGTPSLLNPADIQVLFEAIRKNFQLDSQVEITLEANPESVTKERILSWRHHGINRISLGLQAYDNDQLKAMDRTHTLEKFQEAYALLRTAGFSNVNIDLIYGFPQQTLADWKKTLESVVSHQPEHISLYALTVEPNTPFAAKGTQVDHDVQGDMYAMARTHLTESGYHQYEVSNFSRPGFQCQHNLIYWRKENYLGVGVGAVGCVDHQRWSNFKNLSDYFKRIDVNRLPHAEIEQIDDATHEFESIMLGLRLREGVRWTPSFEKRWGAVRETLVKKKWLEPVSENRVRITEPMVPFSNQVLLAFMGEKA